MSLTTNDVYDIVQNIRELIRAEIEDSKSCSCCGGGTGEREAIALEEILMRVTREVRDGGRD